MKTSEAYLIAVLALTVVAGAIRPTAAADVVVSYQYDDLDRVTRVEHVADGDTTMTSYTYDAGGNILVVTVGDRDNVLAVGADLQFLLVGRPAPNPFNARVEIVFELRAAQHVAIDIFDVRGRRVRRLLDAGVRAGRTEARWDGRNDDGADVASGTYFVRLATEHRSSNQRLLLVR